MVIFKGLEALDLESEYHRISPAFIPGSAEHNSRSSPGGYLLCSSTFCLPHVPDPQNEPAR